MEHQSLLIRKRSTLFKNWGKFHAYACYFSSLCMLLSLRKFIQAQCPLVTEYSLLSFQQVHGRNLLSIDYDRNIRTEKIYDDHRKFTLRIIYDQLGRPFLWLPSSGLAAVNVSYFFNGRLAGLQRGAMSERTDIDKQGRIISRMFADGKVWSYTYLEKVGDVVLCSENSYKEAVLLHFIFKCCI